MTAKKLFQLSLKLFVTFGIFYLLFQKTDISDLLREFQHTKVSVVVTALALMIAQLLFLSMRWGILINHIEKIFSYIDAIRISLLSQIANMLFITSLGGPILRVALVTQMGASFTKTCAAAVIDRVMTLFALLFFCLLFVPFLKSVLPADLYSHTYAVTLAFLGTALFSIPLLYAFKDKLSALNQKYIGAAIEFTSTFLQSPIALTKTISLSLLAQGCFLMASFLIVQTTVPEVPTTSLLALLPLITLISTAPIGFGGWGIREGAFVIGLGFLNVGAEQALYASIQIGLISTLSIFVLGIPSLLATKMEHLNFAKLVRSSQKK
jgi:uncharacterized membrane protein YbhN (UPF0104 family)